MYTYDFATYICKPHAAHGDKHMDPWALASIMPCHNCGGRLLWAEAGYVPGYRICETCGRSWVVTFGPSAGGKITFRLSVPNGPDGPQWEYGADIDPAEYWIYRERVRRFGGNPASRRVWGHYNGLELADALAVSDLTVSDLAKASGLTVGRIRQLAGAGAIIGAEKRNGVWIFPPSAIDDVRPKKPGPK
jgi:hypothetical protein